MLVTTCLNNAQLCCNVVSRIVQVQQAIRLRHLSLWSHFYSPSSQLDEELESTMAAAQNSTPLAVAKSFLAGIKARDKKTMASLCHPDATACLIREGKPMHTTVANILDRIDFEGAVEQDEVSHDEIEHVDGDFATVWTSYWFYEDGKVSLLF